jgi:hypothetical protein
VLQLHVSVRHGQRRFLRLANAVTQSEIRRLSQLGLSQGGEAPPEQAHDAVETVQQELRRLSASPPGRRASGRAASGRR